MEEVWSILSARVYPYLCRAVRNFVTDHSQTVGLPTKEYYVSFMDVSRRLKYDCLYLSINYSCYNEFCFGK